MIGAGIIALLCLAAIGAGGIMVFAGGMSDDPIGGERCGDTGCIVAILGVVCLVVDLVVAIVS
jgi:hypothetical protein